MADFEDKYLTYAPVDICEMLGQPYKRSGGYCVTACYNVAGHKNGDRKPSMAVYGYERGYYCFSCGVSGTNSWLLKQFDARDENYQPKVIVRPTMPVVEANPLLESSEYSDRLLALYNSLPELPQDAIEMLEAKALFHDMFDDLSTLSPNMAWKWHTNQVRGWGAGVFIPYVQDGKMITARLRVLNPREGSPRFLSMPGNTMHPYNMDAVTRYKTVFVTEGETDCLTAALLELPAVAIPGATSGKAIARLIARAQEYGTRLIVIPDNDDAGEAFARRMQLAGADFKVAVDIARVPFKKDLNEWYKVATGEQLTAFTTRWKPSSPKVKTPLAIVTPADVADQYPEIARLFG